MLLRPALDTDVKMAFAKPEITRQGNRDRHGLLREAGEEARSRRAGRCWPSLVTNDKADILATAYAPAAPDYAKASPFESLLQDDDQERRPLHSAARPRATMPG